MGVLDGKVAIVTGAGRGLGRAHAITLAQEGARVVVNDLGGTIDGKGADTAPAQQVVDEITSAGGQAIPHYADVSTIDGAKSLIELAIQTYDGLDILVNNVGILRDRMLFSMEEDDWDAVMKVHLKGQFMPTRYAGAYWREAAKASGKSMGATLIFTSSEAGIFGNVSQVNYSVAKAGIIMMSIVAARELARYGVRSFAICPRARTRFTESTFGQLKSADDFDPWAPENVSPLLVHLCSEAAAEITAQVFVAGGGVIQLLRGWTVGAEIKQNKRWMVEELATAVPAMFEDNPKGPPPIPDMGVDLGAPSRNQ